MKVLFFGTTLFLLFLVLHLIVWRVHPPKRGIKVLFRMFLGVLILGVLFIRTASYLIQIKGFIQVAPKGFLEYFQICLLFASLALSYVISYSAIEADSPSIAMITNIAKSGQKGLDKMEFGQMMSDVLLIKPRIDDLLADGMVYLTGNKYKLTFTGFLFVSTFALYRRLLSLPKGG